MIPLSLLKYMLIEYLRENSFSLVMFIKILIPTNLIIVLVLKKYLYLEYIYIAQFDYIFLILITIAPFVSGLGKSLFSSDIYPLLVLPITKKTIMRTYVTKAIIDFPTIVLVLSVLLLVSIVPTFNGSIKIVYILFAISSLLCYKSIALNIITGFNNLFWVIFISSFVVIIIILLMDSLINIVIHTPELRAVAILIQFLIFFLSFKQNTKLLETKLFP